MVNTKNILMTLLALILVGVVIYLFPTEKKRIKKQFRTLSSWADKKEQENQLMMGYKMQKLQAVLADRVHVEAPAYEAAGTYDASDVAQRATIGRSRYPTLSLKFFDMDIDVLDAHTAKVITTARLTGISPEDQGVSETHELECTLQKAEGNWLFSEVLVVDVLQK